VEQVPFTVTGPSCDSSDTMFFGALLPITMAEGDRLFVGSAGAYTLSYASHFNGFPPPATHYVG
jgi:ornithine decarboxylase